ncbi:MAG: hypothetical protein K6F07_02665, partial [Bacilli bacterium]|nr:hypothetical protein [Bacilli bacterium]
KNIDTYEKLIKGLFDQHGEWEYFPYKNIFDKYRDLGYKNNPFNPDDFLMSLNSQIDMVQYLLKKSKEDDE